MLNKTQRLIYNFTKPEYQDKDACCWYNGKEKPFSIGFLNEPNAFHILCTIDLIINIILVIYSFIKARANKKKSRASVLEYFIIILSFSRTLISVCWIIDVIIFLDPYNIYDECKKCKVISMIWIFCYSFYWFFLTFTLKRYKQILLSPLTSIMNTIKKLIKYLAISLAVSALSIIISRIGDLNGISPMNTCFISSNYSRRGEEGKSEALYTILLTLLIVIPFGNFISCIYLGIATFRKLIKLNDRESKKLFRKYFLCQSAYFLEELLISILLSVSIFTIKGNVYKTFTQIVSIYSCSTSIISIILRFIQVDKRQLFGIKKTVERIVKYTHNKKRSDTISTEEIGFIDFETKQLSRFTPTVFISICYCLEKSKIYNTTEVTIEHSDCVETKEYTIFQKNLIKLKNSKLSSDSVVLGWKDLEINVIECAPKIFAYLRQMDHINLKEMIESFLPELNRTEIKPSEGQGGGFFIGSYDKQYLLKTLMPDEMELMRSEFLVRLTNHFENNANSLITRIYGLYKLRIKSGMFTEDEVNLILMKNVYGAFNNCKVCKYDLKGSIKNRFTVTESFDEDVMKDLDFKDYERNTILISSKTVQQIKDITKKDTLFLRENNLMDYSLLVVKLSFNEHEIQTIFGKQHITKTNKEAVIFFTGTNQNDNENKEEEFEINLKTKLQEIRFDVNHVPLLRKYLFPSIYSDKAYILAIIDYFQLYKMRKLMETKLKTLITEAYAISAVDPDLYAERFLKNIESITNTEKLFDNEDDNEDDIDI